MTKLPLIALLLAQGLAGFHITSRYMVNRVLRREEAGSDEIRDKTLKLDLILGLSMCATFPIAIAAGFSSIGALAVVSCIWLPLLATAVIQEKIVS
jgi:hypothetical protein